MNHIFYLMGKSSSGKDTVYSRILEDSELIPIVLYTTRPIRAGEREGVGAFCRGARKDGAYFGGR